VTRIGVVVSNDIKLVLARKDGSSCGFDKIEAGLLGDGKKCLQLGFMQL
jgi:hypothetical protein